MEKKKVIRYLAIFFGKKQTKTTCSKCLCDLMVSVKKNPKKPLVSGDIMGFTQMPKGELDDCKLQDVKDVCL